MIEIKKVPKERYELYKAAVISYSWTTAVQNCGTLFIFDDEFEQYYNMFAHSTFGEFFDARLLVIANLRKHYLEKIENDRRKRNTCK